MVVVALNILLFLFAIITVYGVTVDPPIGGGVDKLLADTESPAAWQVQKDIRLKSVDHVQKDAPINDDPIPRTFVLVTSQVVWYAVRLIVDEEQHVSHRIRKLPPDAYSNPEKYLKPGDHIQRRLDGMVPFVNHEGVYIGDGLVCHINTETASAMAKTVLSDKREAHARIDPFQRFVSSEDQEVRVIVHCIRRRSREDICSTARRLAEEHYRSGEYNLLQQNCQHFASYCVLGVEWMSDKEPLLEKAMFIGSIAAIIGAAGYAIFSRNSNDRITNNNNNDESSHEQTAEGGTVRR